MPVRATNAPRVPQTPSSDSRGASDSDATLRASSPAENSSSNKRRKLVSGDVVTAKGRSKATEPKDSTHARILQLAQFIKRGVDLWLNVPQIITVGMALALLDEYAQMEPFDEDYDESQKKIAEDSVKNSGSQLDAYIKAYKGIMALFVDEMEYIEGLDETKHAQLWRSVNMQAEQGRSNDTGSLKTKAHAYVLKGNDTALAPPIDQGTPKSQRGVSHPQLLREIVPMSILHSHGNDPDFEGDLKAHKYKITHTSAPAFLYEDPSSFNPNAQHIGLLRGHFAVRVCRHVFTSPSSALKKDGEKGKATKRSNARIAGQQEVTPEMIAYSCVQARFYISKLENFGKEDENFNFKNFYYYIIKLFNVQSTWSKDTLAWWNRQVFGAPMDEQEEPEDENDDESSFTNIMAAIESEDTPEDAPQYVPQVPDESQTQPDPEYSQQVLRNSSP